MMKSGTLVKAKLGGHHRYLFYLVGLQEGRGMYLCSKPVIDGDPYSEYEHQILIGDKCHWLYADDFEEVK